MPERRRRLWAPRAEYLVPLAIVAVGFDALQAPLGHDRYALAGVVICAAAAYVALALWRRSGFLAFLDHSISSPGPKKDAE